MTELPKKRHLYALNLPCWVIELAQIEANIISGGNIDAYLSKMIETLFLASRPVKKRIENANLSKTNLQRKEIHE